MVRWLKEQGWVDGWVVDAAVDARKQDSREIEQRADWWQWLQWWRLLQYEVVVYKEGEAVSMEQNLLVWW